jgi:integrase
MAHIERRGQSRWRARYRGPDGRERSRTFSRKVDAERFLASVEADKARGQWIDPALGKVKFRDWADRWMATTVHLKPKTRYDYRSLLGTHVLPTFGEVELVRIDRLMVRTWIADLEASGLSASRIRQARHVFASAMKAAVESGFVAANPASGVKVPKARPKEKLFLTAEQVELLADAIDERYRALVYLLAYGGLRWGEAVAVRRRRIDLRRSRVEVAESLAEVAGALHFGPTKTYDRRTVILPAFVRDQLAHHLAGHHIDDLDALVFSSPEGTPLRHSNFWRRDWLPAVRSADVPEGLGIHDLRHTCAALLIAEGAHPKAIQEHLGHSSITVTMDTYGHLFPSQMEELATRLDRSREVALENLAASPRPERGLAVFELERDGPNSLVP